MSKKKLFKDLIKEINTKKATLTSLDTRIAILETALDVDETGTVYTGTGESMEVEEGEL